MGNEMTNETATMTATEWYAQHPVGFVGELARIQRDDNAERPWVVLAYRRNVRNVKDVAIVAGYNRWTGQSISWIVSDFNDSNYDTSQAVEVI